MFIKLANTVSEFTMTESEFPKVDGATAMLPMIGEITKSVLNYSDEEAQKYLDENTHGKTAKVYASLINKCLDYLQRERTWNNIAENLLSNKEWELQMRISSLEACEPETLFSNEVQELVNQALAKLPEKSRHIFIMSRYEGKNYQTIAKETNLSVKSIEFHISKALNLLRKELKDYLPCLLFVVDFFYTP